MGGDAVRHPELLALTPCAPERERGALWRRGATGALRPSRRLLALATLAACRAGEHASEEAVAPDSAAPDCNFGLTEQVCFADDDGDGDGWPDQPCEPEQGDLTFETPLGYEGAANFFPDLDGDGRAEVVSADIWLLQEPPADGAPHSRQLFLSRAFCAAGATLPVESASTVVVSASPMVDVDLLELDGERWYRLIPVGDLDGDGLQEGAVLDTLDGTAGMVGIHSGAALAAGGHLGPDDTVWWVEASAPDTAFLFTDIAPVGDVDGDGVTELFVGGERPGMASAGTAVSGGLLAVQGGGLLPRGSPAGGVPFDIDGDGIHDIAFSDYWGDAVYLWSGDSYAADSLTEDNADARVGGAKSANTLWTDGARRVSDVDGDGTDDLIVHALATTESVALLRGGDLHGDVDASEAWFRVEQDDATDRFGVSCTPGDGSIIVEAQSTNSPFPDYSAPLYYSAGSVSGGGVRITSTGPDGRFGWAALCLAADGDADGNGSDDVLLVSQAEDGDHRQFLILTP